MNSREYAQRHYPLLAEAEEGLYVPLSTSHFKKKDFAVSTFLLFLEERGMGNVEFDIYAIANYMLFRVLGDDTVSIRADNGGNGTLSLSTFLNSELNPLLVGLKQRFKENFDLTPSIVRRHPLIRNHIQMIRTTYGEVVGTVHANPIWEPDERRLFQCLSHDTAGLRDRALLIVLLVSGARGHSVAQIRTRIHVREENDNFGAHLRILIPASKTPRGDASVILLRDSYYEDVLRWLRRRKQIFPDIEQLFVTHQGTKISAENVTMMLATLSALAGYGKAFFSCHSTRMGFCARMHAKNLAEDRSSTEVFDNMAASGQWQYQSRAMRQYVDSRIGSFFTSQHKHTYESFRNLCPTQLHGLARLDLPLRRGPSWFCHSPSIINRLWQEIAPQDEIEPVKQGDARSRMANILYDSNEIFRNIVRSIAASSNGASLQSALVLSYMLERNLVQTVGDIERLTLGDIADVQDDVLYTQLETGADRTTHHSYNARATRIHPIVSLVDAEVVQTRLRKRTRENRVNLGRLTNTDRTVVLTYPENQRRVVEVTNTNSIEEELDYFGHLYNLDIPSPASISDRDVDELQELTPTSIQPQTPLIRRIRHISTPSTSATATAPSKIFPP